jgi:cytochrome c-type protein NapC
MTEKSSKSIFKGRRRRWGVIISGFVLGVIFWGGFNWSLEATNTEPFCISCHEMKDNVYAEYRNTVHYQNASGVRATCPDCHVPREWGPKMIRKIQASNELLGKMLGTIDTPEKFADHRLAMASREWKRMKANDSQECRNCHKFSSFDYAVQGRRASDMHQQGFTDGKTCIDCHKGIAHALPPVHQGVGADRVSGEVPPEVFHPVTTGAAAK